MSVLSDIRQTLEEHLDTDATLPTLKAWENFILDPQTNTPFLKISFVPSGSSVISLGGDRLNVQHRGIFSVTGYVKQGIGPSEADDLADKVMQLFKPGSALTGTSGQPVWVLAVERGRGFDDPPFYQVSTDVRWYSFELITH